MQVGPFVPKIVHAVGGSHVTGHTVVQPAHCGGGPKFSGGSAITFLDPRLKDAVRSKNNAKANIACEQKRMIEIMVLSSRTHA